MGGAPCYYVLLRRCAALPGSQKWMLKKMVSWIARTTAFSKPTLPPQDRDAHWRVEQGEVADLQLKLIGGASLRSGTKYLAVTQRPALSRRPKMAALPCQIRRLEQQVLYLNCN